MGGSRTKGPKSTFTMLAADRKAQLHLKGHTALGSLDNAPSTATISFSTSRRQEESNGAVPPCWSQPAAGPAAEQEEASLGWLDAG